MEATTGSQGGTSTPDAEFGRFYREHYAHVVRLIVFRGGTFEEAEDAAQGAMVELYRRWGDPTRPVDNPAGWVRTVAVRKFIRKRQRDRDGLRRMNATDHAVNAAAADPRHQYDVDLREWILEILNRLPPAQRDVLALIFDGLSPADIAIVLDKDPQTIRSNLAHARRRVINEAHKNDLRIPRPATAANTAAVEQQKGE